VNQAINDAQDRNALRYCPNVLGKHQSPGVNTSMSDGRGLNNGVVLSMQEGVLNDTNGYECDLLRKRMRWHNQQVLTYNDGLGGDTMKYQEG
jgi:hypothetical protein